MTDEAVNDQAAPMGMVCPESLHHRRILSALLDWVSLLFAQASKAAEEGDTPTVSAYVRYIYGMMAAGGLNLGELLTDTTAGLVTMELKAWAEATGNIPQTDAAATELMGQFKVQAKAAEQVVANQDAINQRRLFSVMTGVVDEANINDGEIADLIGQLGEAYAAVDAGEDMPMRPPVRKNTGEVAS